MARTELCTVHFVLRAELRVMATSPKIDLANKVSLVTGAAQGIGLAAAQALLKNGAKVSMRTTPYLTARGLV